MSEQEMHERMVDEYLSEYQYQKEADSLSQERLDWEEPSEEEYQLMIS